MSSGPDPRLHSRFAFSPTGDIEALGSQVALEGQPPESISAPYSSSPSSPSSPAKVDVAALAAADAAPEMSRHVLSESSRGSALVSMPPHASAKTSAAWSDKAQGMASSDATAKRPGEAQPLAALDIAIARTQSWLSNEQSADGYWVGELEGDSILQSETILLLAWLGEHRSTLARRCANQLLATQLPTGGWSMYPGGRVEISGSVKAYFALKLAGHAADSEPLQRARSAILAHGGADAVNSFTRFYLALLGQIPFELCPAVPPEFVLLPNWSPINVYRISAWSRTIFVPLSIVWALRPVRAVPEELGIGELFLRPPAAWPALRSPGAAASTGAMAWERLFRGVDRGLKMLERWNFRPLRDRALRAAERWMLDRFHDSDGLGAIYPPIVWSWIALRSLGYPADSREVAECRKQLEALVLINEPPAPTHESSAANLDLHAVTHSDPTHSDPTCADTTCARLQPCLSPVWDTAITLRALAATEVPRSDESVERAVDWLLSKEVRGRGDWAERVKAEPGGWFFEHRNAFYPDIDDTIMVAMALREWFDESWSDGSPAAVLHPRSAPNRKSPEARLRLELAGAETALTIERTSLAAVRSFVARWDRVQAACRRAVAWTLAMQNRDGGWGAFDRNNDAEFLCHVPFADHNAMIDPSTPDITARVLEMLGGYGHRVDSPAVAKALGFLRRTQESDGAWYGRWGVNYIYGTWQTLVGLRAVHVPLDDPMVRRGAEWLLRCQQPNGGWGESADSYDAPASRGQGPATASQTAWALLGLLAAGRAMDSATSRGAQYLLDTQRPDGRWDEPEFTGTGFPRVFYLRYHLYPVYFPLLALGVYRRETA
ncbi:MAG: Squalene--hopene cyclase [Planctomycetota bacterium]